MSFGVLPLFYSFDGVLYPLGSAFTVGRKIQLIITAKHNIEQSIKREPKLSRHLYTGDEPPEEASVNRVGLWVLHHYQHDEGITFTLRPLEFLNGAPPTDVMFGFPKFSEQIMSLAGRLTFNPPKPGDLVQCFGYTNSSHSEGIDLESVLSGNFNWYKDYSHKFQVNEGCVQNIFTQRFASGHVGGPCFTIDNPIDHGQSGGPVMLKESNLICGVNSAAFDSDSPFSISSLLFPLIGMKIQVGISFDAENKFRLNAKIPLIHLITQDAIPTDRSEQDLILKWEDGRSAPLVSVKLPTEHKDAYFDDYPSMQAGKQPSLTTSEASYRIRRTNPPE